MTRSRGRIDRLWRLIRYRLLIPVFRSPHPPEYTARGVANGVLWGMTPFMGLQTALIVGTWLLLRRGFHRDSSIVQALIWVWVNNPVTMIPLYYVFYLTGLWLIGASPSIGYAAFVALWDASRGEPTFIARVLHVTERIGLAISVGCVPYALAGSWLAYAWALKAVTSRRARRARRHAREL